MLERTALLMKVQVNSSVVASGMKAKRFLRMESMKAQPMAMARILLYLVSKRPCLRRR